MNKVQELIKEEEQRQEETLRLIASENYVSKEVRNTVGSVFMNKYSEGYPSKRYYQGNAIVDELESLTIEKAKKLFGVEHVNVQALSGSPANSAVLFGLLNPGDKIMGLTLSSGGHLTHGHPDITFSGKFFKSVQFGTKNNGVIDYGEVEKLAKKEKPKLMIIGTTAYPKVLDWKKLGEIADLVGAYLVADIAHVAGLVVTGVYPTPVNDAHVVTTTTHKTLRGPKGAMIMVTKKGILKDLKIAQKIDRAVFPGLQGGPHNNTTAGILQVLTEAEGVDFKKYGKKVVDNAKTLAEELVSEGLTLVTGGTECHLMVIDLRSQNLSGVVVAEALEKVNIIVNKNSVPNDDAPPFNPSGIRIGTPAITTRGMGKVEMKKIAKFILEIVDSIKTKDKKMVSMVKKEVEIMCKEFPLQ